jgi:charged multivesicular body protein 6
VRVVADIRLQQEVSEIIAGRISVQDEEEVEDELAALEADVASREGVHQRLPSVPDTQLPVQGVAEEDVSPEPARTRAQTERQAMLA